MFNGNFSLIVVSDSCTYVFSDKIMSFPLFYIKKENGITISDDIYSLQQDSKFDKVGLREVLAFGYTLGTRTLFQDINMIPAGEYIVVGTSDYSVDRRKYHQHLHREIEGVDEGTWLSRLDEVVNRMMDRFIQRVNNRQIVLFLSGGYDSRLILFNLYKRGYRNVICISLRAEEDKDVQVARELAKKFSYNLIVFDFGKSYWKKVTSNEVFWKQFHKCSNGHVIYYPQGYAILNLLDRKLIDVDSVIITGNSGDVVEGNDVCTNFARDKVYTSDDIIDEIISSHGLNITANDKVMENIKSDIIGSFSKKEEYNFVEAQDVFEYFNWYERQSKYVTSDVRNYDEISGNEWALPLWDDEFVNFWLDVPLDLRYKRKLYYEYVKTDNLPTANNDTLFIMLRRMLDRYGLWLIYLFYTIRQIIGYYGNNILYSYHGMITIKEWLYILWKTRGSKVKHITAIEYKYFRKVFGVNIFDEAK